MANEPPKDFLDAYWLGKKVRDLSRDELMEAFYVQTAALTDLKQAFSKYAAVMGLVKVTKTGGD